MALPKKFCSVMSLFPYRAGCYGMDEEDFFEMLVQLCYEADQTRATLKRFQAQACQKIHAELIKQKQETQKLYNPFRNLYLDRCYGNSNMPLGAYLNYSNEESNEK